MIPVLIIALGWWAVSGAVASVKAARATEPNTTKPAANATPNGGRATQRRRINPDDVTFGQWQQAMYRRWKTNLRRHLPGQRLGRRAIDLAGDITAASIAGAAIFGAGFVSGATWIGSRRLARDVRGKTQGAPKTSQRRQSPHGGQQRPGESVLFDNTDWPTGFGPGPRHGGTQNTNKPRNTASDADVIDAEILDDTETPAPPASPFVSDEYADLVGQPELLAHYPDTNGTHMASEILTIHHLFDFSKNVITQAADTAEQDTIRANSASERAEQASNRSLTAGNRAEQAGLIAGDATSQATRLEETAARFSSLNMDSTSLASMTSVIEAANAHAADKRRRAEAEANVAAIAAALAQAEEEAAAAAAASAKSAINLVEAAKGMHDTVQAHQMPHAEAQAVTGNAAAHASVLAVS